MSTLPDSIAQKIADSIEQATDGKFYPETKWLATIIEKELESRGGMSEEEIERIGKELFTHEAMERSGHGWYYKVLCEDCGWFGSSKECGGGHPTGGDDYTDIECAICGGSHLIDDDNIEAWHIKIMIAASSKALRYARDHGYIGGRELVEAGKKDEAEPQLRPAVRWFAEQMELALRRNDHKSGWTDHDGLLDRLREEVDELYDAIVRHEAGVISPNTAPDQVTREAADVANFAMMIADNEGPRIGDRRNPALRAQEGAPNNSSQGS